mmetsp:Transcript_2007/g.7953  ORF Transcript_2007/g.7953 Transcript_2007/m.7953 type:complete len:150 (-) Transcript_2007:5821-6270(-)
MDVLQRYSPGKQDSHCVSILNEFCQKLRCSQLPQYDFTQKGPHFFCRISLPIESGINAVFEEKDFTKKAAKAKAAVRAVLHLREIFGSGALGPVSIQRGPVKPSAEPAKVEVLRLPNLRSTTVNSADILLGWMKTAVDDRRTKTYFWCL